MGSQTIFVARIVRFGAALLAMAIAALAVVAFIPTMFGRQVLIVTSRSMEPWANVGDVLVTQLVEAKDIGVGDVVTFKPENAPATTHRVIEVVSRDGNASTFRTQGDANENADPKPVRIVGEAPRSQFVIPFAGRILVAVRTPAIFAALVLAGLAVTALERACERLTTREGPQTATA